MPYIGYKSKKSNLPASTAYEDEINAFTKLQKYEPSDPDQYTMQEFYNPTNTVYNGPSWDVYLKNSSNAKYYAGSWIIEAENVTAGAEDTYFGVITKGGGVDRSTFASVGGDGRIQFGLGPYAHMFDRNLTAIREFDLPDWNTNLGNNYAYSVIITKAGATYYAFAADGSLLSSNAVFDTVLAAACTYGGDILISSYRDGDDWSIYTFSNSFAGQDLIYGRVIYLGTNVGLRVKDGYTGYVFKIKASYERTHIFGRMGVIYEDWDLTGTLGVNHHAWTAIILEALTDEGIYSAQVRDLYVFNAGTGVKFKTAGNGFINGNQFERLWLEGCRYGFDYDVADATRCIGNTYDNCAIEPYAGIGQYGWKNVIGSKHMWDTCSFWDNDGTMIEVEFTTNSYYNKIEGGNITGALGNTSTNKLFIDNSTAQDVEIQDWLYVARKMSPLDLTPAALTGNVNNYNPTGYDPRRHDRIRISSNASRDMTGFIASPYPKNKLLSLLNIGSNNIVLKNSSGSSNADAQFLLGADVTLTPNAAILLIYDNAKWRRLA